MIESKYYYEDSTQEEINSIKKRARVYENNIIWFDEIPIQTPFSVDISFDEIERLASHCGNFALLVNLEAAARPDARTRKRLNERFTKLKDKLAHCAVITGKNILINTAIKFVFYGMGINSYSVSTTTQQALKHIPDELK